MYNKLYLLAVAFIPLCTMNATIIDETRQIQQERLVEQEFNKFFMNLIQQAILDDINVGVQRSIARSLNDGANVNMRTVTGYTPVLLAARHNAPNLLRMLVKWPTTDLTARSNDNKTALLLASEVGSSAMVRMLLQKPAIVALVNEQDDEEHTALIQAAQYDNMPIVEQLLQVKNIDPNIRDHTGKAAIHYAAIANRPAMIQALLARPETDPLIKTDNNRTALDLAAFAGNLAAVMALLVVPHTPAMIQSAKQQAQFRFTPGMNEVDKKETSEIIAALDKAYATLVEEQKSHAATGHKPSKRRKVTQRG